MAHYEEVHQLLQGQTDMRAAVRRCMYTYPKSTMAYITERVDEVGQEGWLGYLEGCGKYDELIWALGGLVKHGPRELCRWFVDTPFEAAAADVVCGQLRADLRKLNEVLDLVGDDLTAVASNADATALLQQVSTVALHVPRENSAADRKADREHRVRPSYMLAYKMYTADVGTPPEKGGLTYLRRTYISPLSRCLRGIAAPLSSSDESPERPLVEQLLDTQGLGC